MTALAQEAATISILLQLGVISTKDVIDWADENIVRVPKPRPLLIELSTTPANRLDLISEMLSALKMDSDYWPAVRDALATVHSYVLSRPQDAEKIAQGLYLVASNQILEVPEDLQFMYGLDDAFYLARENGLGNENDARLDMLLELAKFKVGQHES